MPSEPCQMVHDVSVIIVNHNAGQWLLRSVSSALTQAKEVIIVDNASKDDSIKIIQASYSNEPNLQIIHSEANLGFAKGCNKGAKAASASYLLFLNPDCELQPNAIDYLLRALNQNPQAAMAGGVLINQNGKEERGSRRHIPTLRQAFINLLGLSYFFGDFNLHRTPLPSIPITIGAISGAMMLIKKTVFADIKGFDEAYFLHCEDLDLCMKLRQANWQILFVPKAVGIHAKGECSKSRPYFVLKHKHNGMVYFYKKFFQNHHSRPVMMLVTLGIWIRFIKSICTHFVAKTLSHAKTSRL